MPTEEKLYFPGSLFSMAMKSGSVLAPLFLLAITTLGVVPSMVTGVSSFIGSMLSFMNMGLVTIGAAIAPASTDPSGADRATASTAMLPGRAHAVVDDETRAELVLQRIHDHPGEEVEPRSWPEPEHDGRRPWRPVLRRHRRRQRDGRNGCDELRGSQGLPHMRTFA